MELIFAVGAVCSKIWPIFLVMGVLIGGLWRAMKFIKNAVKEAVKETMADKVDKIDCEPRHAKIEVDLAAVKGSVDAIQSMSTEILGAVLRVEKSNGGGSHE